MSDKTFFQDKWLEDQAFGDWLQRDKDRNRAQCLACAKTFSLGNMGICAVKSHATKSVKHQENVQRLLRQKSTGLPVNAFFTKMSSESSCKGKY